MCTYLKYDLLHMYNIYLTGKLVPFQSRVYYDDLADDLAMWYRWISAVQDSALPTKLKLTYELLTPDAG